MRIFKKEARSVYSATIHTDNEYCDSDGDETPINNCPGCGRNLQVNENEDKN